ncbi:MAG: PAS domain-containing sensor histidine kinase [Candidatus Obscuribacterales bacterium]|nr:PAS domain-containing sensor histidine kinase [Candidatus Obscuribacterales bacterium]
MDGNSPYRYLLASIAVSALSASFLCQFSKHLAINNQDRTLLVLVVIIGYVASTSFLILHSRKLKTAFVEPAEKCTAVLLAALEDQTPKQGEGLTLSVNEIALLASNEIKNLRQGQKTIVDYAADLLCTLDGDCRITELNANAENIWQYANISILGSSIFDLCIEADRDKFKSHFAECKTLTSENTIEIGMRSARNKTVDFAWTTQWSPSIQSYYCAGKNISAEKEIERLRSEIMAMVSHDLRAPVSALSFFLESLLSGKLGTLSGSGQTQAAKIRENVDQILRLINQLLDSEKLETGGLSLEMKIVPASSIIEKSINILAPLAAGKEIKIIADESEDLVFADFDRSIQILNNILSNAIKWSPQASEIKICCKADDDYISFEVKDCGPGIAAENWQLIFERFKTTVRGDTTTSGAGLGLYIAKRLVELHDGKIGLISVPGKGSTFWFSLKRADESDLPGYLE